MQRAELTVHIAFDKDAGRWYVADSEVPGLCLEADTPGQLLSSIADISPELIELNLPELRDAHV